MLLCRPDAFILYGDVFVRVIQQSGAQAHLVAVVLEDREVLASVSSPNGTGLNPIS